MTRGRSSDNPAPPPPDWPSDSPPDSSANLRPAELQDWLNRAIYHPLAWRLAHMLRGGPVTPNMVSLAGGGAVLIAAWLYVKDGGVVFTLAALLSHMVWHILDGADGDLARLQGTASRFGEMVDGLCDYTAHIVLYIVLGIMLADLWGPMAWILTLGAGASRIVQANFYETLRRQYQHWVFGTAWLRVSPAEPAGVLEGLAKLYLRMGAMLGRNAEPVDRWFAANGPQADRLRAQRTRIAAEYAPVLLHLPLLGANYRTLALGASMLAGTPTYYFLFETVVLNILLWRMVRRSRAAIGRIADGLPTDGDLGR